MTKSAELIVASGGNEWYTPRRYIESARVVLGKIDLDPASCLTANALVGASRFFDEQADGLAHHWGGVTCGCPQRIWLNPPYGRLAGKFVAKLFEEIGAGNVRAAIVLVNAHSADTKWFHPLWDLTLCFTDHRIDFDGGRHSRRGASTHGSVFAYYGTRKDVFASEFEQYGPIVHRANRMPVWSTGLPYAKAG